MNPEQNKTKRLSQNEVWQIIQADKAGWDRSQALILEEYLIRAAQDILQDNALDDFIQKVSQRQTVEELQELSKEFKIYPYRHLKQRSFQNYCEKNGIELTD